MVELYRRPNRFVGVDRTTRTMTTDLARTHYPDAIVARAVVLAAEGHSIRRIESDLAKEFPDEVTPSRDTVRRWALAQADLSREEEGDRVQRIITLADDAVVAGLQGARESEHPERSLMATNAVAGTYRDKRDRQTGGTVNLIALVTARAAEIQATIEGAYKVLGDADTDGPALNDVSPPAAPEPERDTATGTPGT